MEERFETINIREALKGFFADLFKTESEASEKEESELPEELRMVVNSVDEGASKLIDRKYTPKRSKDLSRKNSLRKDLKEATKSSHQIQGAEFIKKSNNEIEENTSSKEIAD